MRVLVTGAGGFLASYIIPALVRRGDEVVGVDVNVKPAESAPNGLRDRVRFVNADIVDPVLSEQVLGVFDCVIHLAAIAAPRVCDADPSRAFDINVNGTHNVLKLAMKVGAKRVVFSSSAHCYGISPKYLPTDERHPLQLLDTYTTTKLLGEQLCRLFSDNYGLPHVTLRLYNGYGPGQTAGYFIPDMIAKAKAGRIAMKGSGVTKDWVFVEDVARAFVAATDTPFVGALNVGSGVETSLGAIAGRIARAFDVPLTFLDYPKEQDTRMWCDGRWAGRVLGWTPRIDLDNGLAVTLREVLSGV